ncbi:putative long-chain-alcohol oxidase FAO4A-like [Sesbania bispinosa]|nr:putative long-chain-alcohol oxidase FAO4A-like [Sesbania bispinosa]
MKQFLLILSSLELRDEGGIMTAARAEEIGTHHNKGRTLNVKQVSYHEFEKFVKEESSRTLTDLSKSHDSSYPSKI